MCDPTCGGGAFLLAAADALAARGIDRRTIAAELLWGADLDPGAVEATTAAIRAWAAADVEPNVVVADALDGGLDGWCGRFDVVVGNPPFLSPLAAGTPTTRRRPGAYTDTSALVLLAAIDLAAPGGTVVMIQPASLLAARDAAPVRRTLLVRAALTGLWVAGERVFAAEVRVCAPVLRRSAPAKFVRRWSGAGVDPGPPTTAAPAAATWAPLVASVPNFSIGIGRRTLGELCEATAGFRDEFYGLAPHVVDGGDGPRLVTAGLIDPAVCHWGERTARVAGRSFLRPTVETAALDPAGAGARWCAANARPKIVVATQTRVVEAAVDTAGDWVAAVPTVAVFAEPGDLWLVLAALLAPAASAWAIEQFGGTGLSADSVRVSARQLLALPLPADRRRWRAGAELLSTRGAAGLDQFARTITGPGGDELVAWWARRLPSWHRSRRIIGTPGE